MPYRPEFRVTLCGRLPGVFDARPPPVAMLTPGLFRVRYTESLLHERH
jgi:hypothetical protein